MTSTEESGNVQIMGLPDDLLMEIFSYITFIPTKMYLEQVCKRFHFVSSRPASWKGIHKLEMTMICKFKYDEEDYEVQRMIDLEGSSEDSDSEEEDGEIDYKKLHLRLCEERPGYKYYFNIYMNGDKNRIREAVDKWADLEQASDFDDDRAVFVIKRMIIMQRCGMKGSRLLLNGINVPFTKWSNAIQSLLERTNIHQLIIHNRNYNDNDAFNPTQLPPLIAVLQRNVNKMKLNSIECHLNVDDWTPLATYQLSSILIKSLRISVPHLEEFAFHVKGIYRSRTGSFPKIWPILKKCNCLKSIKFNCGILSVDLTALIGKPLAKLEVYNAANILTPVGGHNLNNLIEVMNNAEGIQSLIPMCLKLNNTPIPMPFHYFHRHLNENSRKKLKFLRAGFIKPVEINHLHLVPSIFPNLETIEIIIVHNHAIEIDQLCTMVVSFFNVANAESSNCKMKFESLKLGGDDWQMNLLIACQNAEINIEFDNPSQGVFMSKGNASITIDTSVLFYDIGDFHFFLPDF